FKMGQSIYLLKNFKCPFERRILKMKHLTKFILAVFCIGTIALIGAIAFDPPVAEASITNRIQGSSTDGLSDNIDQAGSSLVDTARDIGIVVIFIFIIWIGYALF